MNDLIERKKLGKVELLKENVTDLKRRLKVRPVSFSDIFSHTDRIHMHLSLLIE